MPEGAGDSRSLPAPGGAVADWVRVADLKELQRRKKELVFAGGEPIALFWVDGQVYALRDICIHKQRSLSRGLIFQGRVVCPGHQWAFDLCTGWIDEWMQCQPTYQVKVEGDSVFVDPTPRVRTAAPAPSERWQRAR